MINFLAFMQVMFGNLYPLYFSAMFAALSAYFGCFYESPDKIALTLLAAAASLGWLCLHSAEVLLFKVVNTLENASKTIEEILRQPKD